MQIIECFEVNVWDGGGGHNLEFYVSSEAEAEKWLKSNPHDYTRKVTLCVFDSLEERENNSPEALKKSALSKLTPLERKAIGFGNWEE